MVRLDDRKCNRSSVSVTYIYSRSVNAHIRNNSFNMLRFKWLKEKLRRRSFDEAEEDSAMADDDHQKDKDEPITIINTDEWETPGNTQLKFVYFTLMTSDKDIIDHLIESERDIQVSSKLIIPMKKSIISFSDF